MSSVQTLDMMCHIAPLCATLCYIVPHIVPCCTASIMLGHVSVTLWSQFLPGGLIGCKFQPIRNIHQRDRTQHERNRMYYKRGTV